MHDPRSDAVALEYLNLLREYRLLKPAAQPWLATFAAQHGRPAGLQDVDAAPIPAPLSATLRQFLLAQRRLRAELPQLRQKLSSGHHHGAGAAAAESAAAAHGRSQGESTTGAQAVQNWAKAMTYKQSKKSRESAAGSKTTLPSLGQDASAADGASATAGSGGETLAAAGGADAAAPLELAPTLGTPPGGAPPRVQQAVLAAAEYRRKGKAKPLSEAEAGRTPLGGPSSTGGVGVNGQIQQQPQSADTSGGAAAAASPAVVETARFTVMPSKRKLDPGNVILVAP